MSYNLLTQTPINVSVDGFSSYAIIEWLAEDTSINECEGRVRVPIPFSQKIYIDPLNCGSQQNVIEGLIVASRWGGNRDVTYRITQLATKDCDCDPYKELNPNVPHEYGIISTIAMPYYLESTETATTFSITYYESFINECNVERVFTAATTVRLTDGVTDCNRYGLVGGQVNIRTLDNKHTFNNVPYEFYHMRPSYCGCEDGTTIVFGKATYTPSIVPYTGGSVKVTKPYIEITMKDCIETRESKVSSYTIDVSANTECKIIYDVEGEDGLIQLYDQDNGRCPKCGDGSNYDKWYDGVKILKVMDAEPYTDEDGHDIDGKDVSCECESTERPQYMMPYYGGIAYARIEVSAITSSLTENCIPTSSVTLTKVIIPIEIEPIDIKDCDPDTFLCNSYEVVYGISSNPNHQDTVNRDVVCIAQSTDCERQDDTCDSDDFSINPTERKVYCNAVENSLITTLHSFCIGLGDVSAYTDSDWIELIGIDNNTHQVMGYNICANISSNTTSNEDRIGHVTIKHDYLGVTYSSDVTITQQKCNLNCGCGSIFPVDPKRESPISAHTTLSYSGNTNDEALWVYNVMNGCSPTNYCITPNEAVYDISTRTYEGTNYTAVYGKVTDNENPKGSRNINLSLSFNDGCEESCTNESAHITQSKFICDCEKLDESNSFMRQDIPSQGESDPTRKIKIGEISTYNGASGPICANYKKIVCEQDPNEEPIIDSVEVLGVSNGTNNGSYTNVDVMATVYANTTSSERTFSALVYVANSSNEDRTHCFTLVGKQEGAYIPPSFDVKLQFGVDSNYGSYTYTDSTSEYVKPFDGGLRIYVDTTFQGELTVDLVGELTHGEETPRPSKFWIWDDNYPSQVSSLESFNFQPNGPSAWYAEGTEYDRPSATINLVDGGVLKVNVQYR